MENQHENVMVFGWTSLSVLDGHPLLFKQHFLPP